MCPSMHIVIFKVFIDRYNRINNNNNNSNNGNGRYIRLLINIVAKLRLSIIPISNHYLITITITIIVMGIKNIKNRG